MTVDPSNGSATPAPHTDELGIFGFGAWTPRYPSAAAWLERDFAGDGGATVLDPPEPARPTAGLIPARQRRRATLMARMAATSVGEAAAQAGWSVTSARCVFASMLGEVDAAATLIEMMSTSGMLSPMRFQNSVHNTSAGIVSIATDNRGFSTTLSAGWDLVAMGVLESLALAAESDEPVFLVLQEETWPQFLRAPAFDPLCVALALGRPAPGAIGRIGGLARRAADAVSQVAAPSWLAANPVAPALGLLDAVHRGREGVLAVEASVDAVARPWSVVVGGPE